MTICKADSKAKVRDLITVNFLTVVILSQVAVFTGLTLYGISGNITTYNCQWRLNLRHALWQWLEPLSR